MQTSKILVVSAGAFIAFGSVTALLANRASAQEQGAGFGGAQAGPGVGPGGGGQRPPFQQFDPRMQGMPGMGMQGMPGMGMPGISQMLMDNQNLYVAAGNMVFRIEKQTMHIVGATMIGPPNQMGPGMPGQPGGGVPARSGGNGGGGNGAGAGNGGGRK